MPQEFNPTTAENFSAQLQVYQNKIDAKTITQTELNQAKSLAVSYYQFLNDAGINYGGLASEVVQGSTFYGQYANGLLNDALREKFSFSISESEARFNRDQIAISLAVEDSILRSQTSRGALSSRQIADYHYSIFGRNNIPREAWGGAMYEEFIAPSSWMEARHKSISEIFDDTSIFFSGLLAPSDDIVNGVSRNKASLRVIDTSAFFDGIEAELQESLLLNGIKLISLFANSNSINPNKSVLVARDGDNIMVGNRNQPNTFYIPNLNGQNVINDFDQTGRIVIGNGRQSIKLEGIAIPKKDSSGNIIENQWTLNDYDLIRSGDNLVIIPAGGDISSLETPRITIANFNFDLQKDNVFGLSLGKRHVTPPIIDRVITKSDTRISGAPFLESYPNPNGEFIVVRRVEDFTRLTKFNCYGDPIKDFYLGADTISSIQGSYPYASQNQRLTKVLFPFVSDDKICIANFDVDRQEVTATRVMAQGSVFLYSRGAIGNSNYNFYFRYRENYVDANNALRQRYKVQKFDINSLADLEAPIVVLESELINYGGFTTGFPRTYFTKTLQNNYTLTYLPGDGNSVRMTLPRLENIPAAEIPTQSTINAGEDMETSNAEESILTFAKAVDGETAARLKITPVANARLAIRGVENGEIDLEDFNLTPDEIVQRTSQVSANQYSMQDLLDGKYRRERREVDLDALMPGRADELEIDEDELEELSRSRKNDEEFDEALILEAQEDNAEVFTILELPVILANGQNSSMQLIFPKIDLEEFTNQTLLENIVGYVGEEIDFTTRLPANFTPTLNSTPFGNYSTFPPTISFNRTGINTTQAPQIGGNPGLAPYAISAICVGAVVAIAGAGALTYKLITDEEFRENAGRRVFYRC